MDEQKTSPVEAPMVPTAETKKTGSGLDPKIAAALCWFFWPISSIIFLIIEKDDKYVRFHAYQSLFAVVALTIGYIISSILMVVLIGFLLYFVVGIGGLVIWIMGMIKAFQGEMWKLPVIGDMAEEYANK